MDVVSLPDRGVTSPPQVFSWWLSECDRYFTLKNLLNYSAFPPMQKRGSVTVFTPEARMRMLIVIHAIDWPKVGRSLMCTLTYPDSAYEHALAKKSQDRQLFLRGVEKHLGRPVPALWRVEWTKRQTGRFRGHIAPHFHLILGGVQFVPWEVIRRIWRTVVHVNSALCTDVQLVDGGDAAPFYVGKYAAKFPSLDLAAYHGAKFPFGRHWGICRPKLWNWLPIVHSGRLTTEQARLIKGLIGELRQTYHPGADRGATVFGAEAVQALRTVLAEIA